MTVKKLTERQKAAVVTVYDSKTKTITEITRCLGVSTRTIGRVLTEAGVAQPVERITTEARQVMALLYKHKLTVDQLEYFLDNVAGSVYDDLQKATQYQVKRSKKSPTAHNGKQSMLPLNLPVSLELH